ncbi:MAG TPA: carbamoyl phosphate synthase large subunit, partial [Gemmatimonadetes bacterium]|nr:carbamoyl phosphate synthase large subunit [Gemmatimonadota bacterium]
MPRRDDISSILIIGSGPIVIGQACEFDYSGTQAVRALRNDGYRVILLNSNPATIMTDPELADATYIEPITVNILKSVLGEERPDALLPTLGGQTALNVTMEAAAQGLLEEFDVELIGASLDAIETAEDRGRFKETMDRIGISTARAEYVRDVDAAVNAAAALGYPVMVRPSYILGGGGTGLAQDKEELLQVVTAGLRASPVGEVLIEESVAGWKEFELEVMRDHKDNAVIVCSIENVDPMGVHTGDSITVAPAMTLSDREYQIMRDEAIACLRAIGVDTGGSNVQFAVDPKTGRRLIIEMNPRVSRSSALASKATGFPIAKIAAKLAVGYSLDEIPNDITGETPASFEPALDYVVVKVPRFDFAKFPSVSTRLGTSMQSVGEAMAIGRTFPEALQKALRSLETGRGGLNGDPGEASLLALSDEEVRLRLGTPTPERLFVVAEGLRRGMTVESVAEETAFDFWFVDQIARIVETRIELEAEQSPNRALVHRARRLGFSEDQLSYLWGESVQTVRKALADWQIGATFKTVDTCAAEFEANTPYYYSTHEEEDESPDSGSNTVIVLGSGPNRIGQGIEFDYCCVHATMALTEVGFESVMINCNPETVSTDYDTADRLYFEPLTVEDVLAVVQREQPKAVIVQLGGQTPLSLAGPLEAAGVPIAGTLPSAIDAAEDRERFAELCNQAEIPQPPHGTARSSREAVQIASQLGMPVLVRPSFVLGGRAMRVVYSEAELSTYLDDLYATATGGEIDLRRSPLLIDTFLEGATEVDVDALSDGMDVYIGGVMEHVEQAGVHSGDSACIVPPVYLSEKAIELVNDYTKRLALKLEVRGLLNVQYAVRGDDVYVLEANPRASRTIPFISKATGIPLAKIATRVMMGESIEQLYRSGSLPRERTFGAFAAVKEAVLPWSRFPAEDIVLGPEMRSTGEVMGIGEDVPTAYAKAQIAAGGPLPNTGTVFMSLSDPDKNQGIAIALLFEELGFQILATDGTAKYLIDNQVLVSPVDKFGEGPNDPVSLIETGSIDLVINTPRGRRAESDGRLIRLAATRHGVPCLTTVSAGLAAARSLRATTDVSAQVV